MESHPPSQSPVAERTQTGARTLPRVYPLLRKPLGKRHLAAMSCVGRAVATAISSRNGTADSPVFRWFARDVRSHARRACQADSPSSAANRKEFANLDGVGPPRFVRFWRISARGGSDSLVDGGDGTAGVLIYRDAARGRGKWRGRRKGLAFGQPSK